MSSMKKFIRVNSNVRISEQEAFENIRRWRDEYFSRNEASSPYFGGDQCHLVLQDADDVVGVAEFDRGYVSVVLRREDYELQAIMDSAANFFSRHPTYCGVYDAQIQSKFMHRKRKPESQGR